MMVFDIIVLLLLLLGIYYGSRQGLIKMIFFVASIFAALFVARSFGHFVLKLLNLSSDYSHAIAYIVTFVVTFLAVMLLAVLVSKVIRDIGLGLVDRIGGAALGLFEAALLVGICLMFFEGVNRDESIVKRSTLEKSILYSPVLKTAEKALPYIPVTEIKKTFGELSSGKESDDDQ